jgi:type II secretion system protein D
MRPLLAALVFILLASWAMAQMPAPGTTTSSPRDTKLQLPNNPISDVLEFYEALTKKRLIRDATLTGPNLSIEAPDFVTREEAISMIEAALLLNGYSIVPVDDNTVKILGSTKQPRSEAVPLFSGPASSLPNNDQVISYFMPLSHISSDEAVNVFNSYVVLRSYGSIIPVPNVNAVVITENVPLVKRLIDLRKVIDVQGATTLTEFFPLQRADATKVQDMLGAIFENSGSPSAPRPAAPPAGGAPTTSNATAIKAAGGNGVQIFADVRTNRVLVIAPEKQMPYIRKLIADLDGAASFEEPYERFLKFVRAADVLPVLANMLTDDPEKQEKFESEQNSNATNNNSSSNSGSNSGYGGGGYGGGSGGSSGSGGTKPDKLQDPNESTAPLSKIVGNARIIADRSVNKIIVIGPPDSRNRAAKILELLDQQPKQIYLAVVIGQLTLGDGIEAGVDYLIHTDNLKILGQGTAANLGNLIQGRSASIDVVPGTSNVVSAAADAAATASQVASTALPLLSGLTVFGSFGDSVDVLVRALGTSNKFEVISRPVVYTVNNKKAVISSGQQVPVPTSTLTSAISSNVATDSTALQSNIDYKDVVLKLEVIPLINSENEVTLTIAQQNDNVQEQVQISNNSVPVIGTQELRTTVTVPNRNTVVLGGLITDQETRIQTGIPFLKDVPGLGYLFSTTKKDVTRRELIVMIQPFIIDSDAKLKEANMIERGNTSFQSSMYEDKIPVRKAILPDTPRAEQQRKAEEARQKQEEAERKAAQRQLKLQQKQQQAN